MCGRFAAGDLSFGQIREILQGFLDATPTIEAGAAPPKGGYHIRPTDRIALVRQDGPDLRIGSATWQIVTPGGRPLINARIENDRFWRAAMASGRCMIPALGYFEWTGQEGRKTPHFITVRRNAPVIFFAGLLSGDAQGCVILTRAPSPQIAHIHSRMPVILSQAEMPGWLSGEMDAATARADLGNGWDGRFEWHEVAPLRNDAEGPEVIEPYTPPQASFDL